MKVTFTSVTALVIFFSLLFTGCQREISHEVDGNTPPPDGTTIWKTAGVTGQVIDPNGMPVSGADVKFGSGLTQTDKNGYFSFANASFSTGEAFVTVKKAGYFTGSRTFFPRNGSNNYLRMQMILKRDSGSVDAGTGGEVELWNGMKVELPANGIVSASGGTYSGQVNIAAAYLDPAASDINIKMPGDLRGVNAVGRQTILKSFGMVVVELSSPSGQPLNIKSGAKARLTFPVPFSLIADAPANIPLWYFDETTGLWKEEGTAVKQGDQYEGEVSHFTFWNVDVPYDFVKLSMKIVSPGGNPVAGAKVKITSMISGVSAYDFTDNMGYVDGAVSKGEQLKMEVFDNCSNLVLAKTIGPFNSDTDLGNEQVAGNIPLQTIYGTVKDCSGNALANGTLQVILNNNHSEFTTISNGNFSITFLSCAGASSAQLIAADHSGLQEGNPVTVQLMSSNTNAGELQACGVDINTFLNITIDGVPIVWNSTNCEVLQAHEDTNNTYQNGTYYSLVITAGDTSGNAGVDAIHLQRPFGSFSLPASLSPLWNNAMFVGSLPEQKTYSTLDTSIYAIITAYGAIGQFVEGSLNGQLSQYNFTTGFVDTVTVNCSFRVRRKTSIF